MYKVYNNSIAYSVQHLYIKVGTVHSRITRSSIFCFYVPQCNTNVRHKFVIYQGIILWNSLLQNLQICNNLCTFKWSLKSYLFSTELYC